LEKDLSYAQLFEKLTGIFFKNGRNFKGKLSKMIAEIGNAQAKPIRNGDTEFLSLGKYLDKTSCQKGRIYLLTKEQV